MLLAGVISLVCFVCTGNFQHTVSNVILTSTVRLHDGFDEIFRNIGVVRKELLGVLRQAVTAITEAGVIVVTANARIKADALDNLLGVQPLHLRIGVQLVEIADTQSQVGIGEQFDSLSFGKAHDQGVDILLDCTFLEQACKGVGSLHQTSIVYIGTYNNAARVQIVV